MPFVIVSFIEIMCVEVGVLSCGVLAAVTPRDRIQVLINHEFVQ